MGQEYSDPERQDDPHALPDIEVFQLTAAEAATLDQDLVYEASKQFPLMHMNSRDRAAALNWIIEEYEITGGWFYWYCFPGCLPDSSAMGPYNNYQDALDAAHEDASQ